MTLAMSIPRDLVTCLVLRNDLGDATQDAADVRRLDAPVTVGRSVVKIFLSLCSFLQ